MTKAMKVDDYLDNVDYDFPDYVPSKAAVKFITFIKLVNADKGGEENKSPVVHMKMLDAVFNKKKRTAIMCHRGIAKTTLMAEYMFFYIAMFGKLDGFGAIDLALYVSDSMENGCKSLRENMESRYEESEFLKENLQVKFTDKNIKFVNKSGHKTVVKMYGAKTGVRGTKAKGKRPQLAILDDLVSDEDARSATVIATIENTVHKAVSKAMHTNYSKTVWLGTPFNEGDPLYKAVESGAWESAVYPVAEEFDSNTTEDTFKSSWADRFNWEYVKDEYDAAEKQGKLDGFYQELMLRIVSEEERIIKDEDIVPYDYMDIKDRIESLNTYIITDFATSEKKGSDPSAISVWGVNSNNDYLWLDGINKRQLMNRNVEELFRLVQVYQPLAVGIEVTGQQGGFIPWIRSEMQRRQIYFNIVELRPTKSKLERAIEFQPRFKMKKVWYPTNHKTDVVNEHKAQLRSITMSGIKSKHDDCLDTTTAMGQMNVIAPSKDGNSVFNPMTEQFELSYAPQETTNSYLID